MGNTTTSVPDRISSDRSPYSGGTAGARVCGPFLVPSVKACQLPRASNRQTRNMRRWRLKNKFPSNLIMDLNTQVPLGEVADEASHMWVADKVTRIAWASETHRGHGRVPGRP